MPCRGSWKNILVFSLSVVLLSLLVLVVLGALPQIRQRHHNSFENTHRVGDWPCMLLFWPTLWLFQTHSIRLGKRSTKESYTMIQERWSWTHGSQVVNDRTW